MFAYKFSRVLPAITVDEVDAAVAVAKALHDGGIQTIEIAFRTPVAAEAIRAIRRAIPEMVVGAGTLLDGAQLTEAVDAGAHFGLSPGWNRRIAEEAKQRGFPFIPGVMTPGEIEQALETGYRLLKLFPADVVGGVRFLEALKGPYGHKGLGLIPMGGINRANMDAYLALENVVAVGGSWLTPPALIRMGKFSEIQREADRITRIS